MTETSYFAANYILDRAGPVRGLEYVTRMTHRDAITLRGRDWWLAVERDIRERIETASATGELGNWQRSFELKGRKPLSVRADGGANADT